KVPAGNVLAVNREEFSGYITRKIRANKNITVVSEEADKIDFGEYTVIATGPLTTPALADSIAGFTGGALSFFDASAPIVTKESIDFNCAFIGDRYGKGDGDHVNCPLSKEEYYAFVDALIKAERAELHGFEKTEVFEGCMPVEIMAARGRETLRFGPLKAAGLTDPKTGRWPYACLQLRREDKEGNLYNLVGFQTNLKFGEQKRVFSLIPALKNAEFVRYGVMHRNSFINAPKVLKKDLSVKGKEKTFFAGQITGVEGYIESAASGLLAAIYLERKIKGKKEILVSDKTVLGSLVRYITTENQDFEPMNANFGILPPLETVIRDKTEKKRKLAERSLTEIEGFIKEIYL
ncbi:MAG: methylenetetrahydrofolate--tRNA-(uracil(54)-C(5))-methyltransferase (FADH(2)-oxidizing) TrmFO, partial [Clostridia bacterium]|nr:methylenetetrahydrofolate--tRNA-(uracil(54)-C(5))-methyltransferase (FADH(2)-oxidizing) TrmFO [Clostridia bacterium]